MAAIRVLLGDMSPLFSSMISGLIKAFDDVELVENEFGGGTGLATGAGVDVMIIREADIRDCPEMVARITGAAPLGVVSIRQDGLAATSYRLEKSHVPASGEGILDLHSAIRSAAGVC